MAAAKNPQHGEQRWNAKLCGDDVRTIRELRAERERLLAQAAELTDKKIAEKYEVHPNTVWKIGNYMDWYRYN